LNGHAIEARLYAEDPDNDFLPQSGTLIDWRPASGEGLRSDHGLATGCTISPFYDPMLAKLIAQGATREEARRRLIMALEDTVVLGLKTNRSLLIAMLRHPTFTGGEATTAFIDRYFPTEGAAARALQPSPRILALAAVLLFEARARSAPRVASAAQRWSSTGVAAWPLQLTLGNAHHPVSVMTVSANDYLIALESDRIEVEIVHRDDGVVRFDISGMQQSARFAVQNNALYLDVDGAVFEVRDTTLAPAGSSRSAGSLRLLAPMNGVIVGILAKPDDPVAKGQCVVVLEAMKMQHEIVAERDGTIDKIFVKPGDQVATRQLLVKLKPDEAATPPREEAAS
jgi:geranyl-CoA carboxylase alpha subunit